MSAWKLVALRRSARKPWEKNYSRGRDPPLGPSMLARYLNIMQWIMGEGWDGRELKPGSVHHIKIAVICKNSMRLFDHLESTYTYGYDSIASINEDGTLGDPKVELRKLCEELVRFKLYEMGLRESFP